MNRTIRLCISCVFPMALILGGCDQGNPPKEVNVYPIPQELDVSDDWIKIPEEGYRIESTETPDADAMNLLKQSVPIAEQATQAITIGKLDKATDEMQCSGAYTLTVNSNGIHIGIYDDRSLFYAVQTLRQLILDGKQLPVCLIRDYPDIAFRGVVKGFYGTPWSFENRVEQLRFYGRMKMNTYIFGPKDDPYHRSPSWRIPYPEEQADNIRRLVIEARRNKVDFVWALHPGMDIRWNDADRQAAIQKLESMYGLGVRAFAVFFDDIEGEGTDAHKQAAFMNHLKEEFVDKKGDIQQLILCPTEYNKDWAKTDYLDILGEQLDPFIHIMWTGDKVVSDITCEGLQWVNRRIRRPCYVWWNFPVNDYCLAHLLTGPVYGLEKNTATDMHAFVSNPMEFAEASKVALWSISQFTWNMGEFDSEKAWYKACEALVPEAPDAFRLFCEHNADIGPNTWMFFRKESFNSDKLLTRFRQSLSAGTYPEKEAAAIINMFARIRKAPETIRSSSANKQLTKEIDPWLTQTAHVGEAGVEAMKMLELAQKKDTENCRKAYRKTREALETTAVFSRPYRRGEQDGIRSGSQVLLPFIRSIVQHVENTLLTDEKPKERAEVLAGSQAFDELSCFCEDNMVGLTPHFPLVTIAPGEYFGFRIEESKQPVALVYDLRKSKSKGRQFQGSVDGKVWFPLQQTGKDRLDTLRIHESQTRYIRCLNKSQTEMSIGIGRFLVLTEPAAP